MTKPHRTMTTITEQFKLYQDHCVPNWYWFRATKSRAKICANELQEWFDLPHNTQTIWISIAPYKKHRNHYAYTITLIRIHPSEDSYLLASNSKNHWRLGGAEQWRAIPS